MSPKNLEIAARRFCYMMELDPDEAIYDTDVGKMVSRWEFESPQVKRAAALMRSVASVWTCWNARWEPQEDQVGRPGQALD